MSTLQLYSAPGTCALAVQIALIEADAPHEVITLDLANAQQRSPQNLFKVFLELHKCRAGMGC